MAAPVLRISKVHRIGNSAGVTLPAAFCRALGVSVGDYMRLILDGDSISIRTVDGKRLPHRAAPSKRGLAHGTIE